MEDKTTLTPEEVAAELKIARNTVYEIIKRGELPAYRVGKKLRVDRVDVEAFKQKGKQATIGSEEAASPAGGRQVMLDPGAEPKSGSSRGLVVCGQDVLLDILTHHLERQLQGIRASRNHVGSFAGLLMMYQDLADMASVHLWDGDTDTYNVPYVRRLLPGIPTVLVHLGCRLQGFYVRQGNPREIHGWEDLLVPGVRFVNREPGSGTRVLLDEKLRHLGLERRKIEGYEHYELSHLAVASAVARGSADVGLGNQKGALQVKGIEFIPMQKERYDLAIKRESLEQADFQLVLEVIRSAEFKAELEGLGDYDLAETGKIVATI